jgi:hypothetical protein
MKGHMKAHMAKAVHHMEHAMKHVEKATKMNADIVGKGAKDKSEGMKFKMRGK